MDKKLPQYCIKRSDWEKLSEDSKDKLKEEIPTIEVVDDDFFERNNPTHFVTAIMRETLKEMPRVDPYYQEQRAYEREQMRNRTRYMNKHQRYPKK